MHQHHINRRQFVAASAAVTASAAIASPALSAPLGQSVPLNIPSPSLARVIPSNSTPTNARLQPVTHTRLSTTKLVSPFLTLTPLPCVDTRLSIDASITIELLHPTPNLYSILYRAHNITIPNKSIPSYATSIQTKSPSATPILKITQRTKDASKSTLLTLAPGTHLLAVPTATTSSNASFRFTSAILDEHTHQITKLTHPMPATSRRCAYFSITISDKSTGE